MYTIGFEANLNPGSFLPSPVWSADAVAVIVLCGRPVTSLPPLSREIGLLPIFLFSDVKPHGGGTAVIRGSHKTVAELLWNQAGTKGLTGALRSDFQVFLLL